MNILEWIGIGILSPIILITCVLCYWLLYDLLNDTMGDEPLISHTIMIVIFLGSLFLIIGSYLK